MITIVHNLATGAEIGYCLPPEKAVVCAFEQETRKNCNTWAYDFSKARVSNSGRTVSCGDWVAITNQK